MSSRQPEDRTDPDAVDAIHHALAGEHRRSVVRYLRDNGPATFDELVEHVRADGERAPTDDVATRLHHVTLPTLAACDLVEYDRDAGTVAYVGGPLVEEHLRPIATAASED